MFGKSAIWYNTTLGTTRSNDKQQHWYKLLYKLIVNNVNRNTPKLLLDWLLHQPFKGIKIERFSSNAEDAWNKWFLLHVLAFQQYTDYFDEYKAPKTLELLKSLLSAINDKKLNKYALKAVAKLQQLRNYTDVFDFLNDYYTYKKLNYDLDYTFPDDEFYKYYFKNNEDFKICLNYEKLYGSGFIWPRIKCKNERKLSKSEYSQLKKIHKPNLFNHVPTIELHDGTEKYYNNYSNYYYNNGYSYSNYRNNWKYNKNKKWYNKSSNDWNNKNKSDSNASSNNNHQSSLGYANCS